MMEILDHGDVRELRFSSWVGRRVGYAVSCFVTRGLLVDCAFPKAADELASYLDANPVEGLVLTHAHEDHSGNTEMLASWDLPVHCATLTDTAMRQPERIGLYRRFTWGARKPLHATLSRFTPRHLQLRATPGHSADHHVVWDAERGTVFGGDLFVGVKVRIAHHDEDLRRQLQSLREVASWQPERFFDAHRGLLSDPAGQLRAKADWIEETIARIEARVRDGWADRAIRDEVLGPEDATGRWSFGSYSRLNFVRNVRATMPPTA